MAYRTGFRRWIGGRGDFLGWELSGLAESAEGLSPEPGTRGRVSREMTCAEATSPEFRPSFAFREAVASWNAVTPPGTWMEISLRIRVEGSESPWYSMGIWSSETVSAERHSITGQSDEFARILTDKLVAASAVESYRIRVRFFSVDGLSAPTLRSLSLAYSDSPPAPSGVLNRASERSGTSKRVEGRSTEHRVPGVPRYSQMLYPDGGDAWCSPTCLAMVMGYWLGDGDSAEKRVRSAVAGVFDRSYGGCGNWSFNVAHAGSRGFEAYVVRFSSMDELEPWIASGIPVVLSVSWNAEEGRPLLGAPIAKSRGHLTLLVGFDAMGDLLMHEPASPSDESVARGYDRKELEARWIEASGGTAYIVYPRGGPHPAFLPE